MDVTGLGVVVTGAGGGIGRAIATRLAAEGARVVVNDIDAPGAEATAAELGAHAVPGDAASETGVATLVAEATDRLGRIDVYCANAGVEGGGGLDTPEADWSRALEVNVMAHVRAARLLVPGWLEGGGGRFVVTASAAGLLTMLGSAPYSVTKHAAVAFAEWLAIEYHDKGIRVSCLCPQAVQTAMTGGGRGGRARRGGRAPGDPGTGAARDGVLPPERVAEAVVEGVAAEEFLILPHPEVATYERRRADDRERWLRGMRRAQAAMVAAWRDAARRGA
jgi:NAD(P)-dependent dehydrogenase (short-subunit alcohol dehydrogenase family)